MFRKNESFAWDENQLLKHIQYHPKLFLVLLQNVPIFEQLKLEEILLRTDERNFCILNYASPRAIIMGFSGIPEEILNLKQIERDQIAIIKRCSGGGTVVIDENTLFISFIFATHTLSIDPFPESILRWTTAFYTDAWNLPGFGLCENDYIIDNRKCGGNAQYIRKTRWLHHTSFLWDFSDSNMDYLLLPPKRPIYRQNRSHLDFLCRLKKFMPTIEMPIAQVKQELSKRFAVSLLTPAEINTLLQRHCQQSSHFLVYTPSTGVYTARD